MRRNYRRGRRSYGRKRMHRRGRTKRKRSYFISRGGIRL